MIGRFSILFSFVVAQLIGSSIGEIEVEPISVIFQNKTEFLFFNQSGNFFDAQEACTEFDPDATLARIDTKEEFEFIPKALGLAPLVPSAGLFDIAFWIGLKDDVGNDQLPPNQRFKFVDGVEDNIDFFKDPEQLPWFPTRPLALNYSLNCVGFVGVMNKTNQVQFGWVDVGCDESEGPAFLCRREIQKENEVTDEDEGTDSGEGTDEDDGRDDNETDVGENANDGENTTDSDGTEDNENSDDGEGTGEGEGTDDDEHTGNGEATDDGENATDDGEGNDDENSDGGEEVDDGENTNDDEGTDKGENNTDDAETDDGDEGINDDNSTGSGEAANDLFFPTLGLIILGFSMILISLLSLLVYKRKKLQHPKSEQISLNQEEDLAKTILSKIV